MAERPLTTLELTTDVVACYLQKNRVAEHELTALIQSVYDVITGMGTPTEPEAEAVTKPTAAQIRKSIRPDGLVSFIDGKPYAVMKRHLSTQGMTPASYRERYGLPTDYPMVSPEYSARRSAMAKAIGLGAKGRTPRGVTPVIAMMANAVKPAKRTMKPVSKPTV